jgi:hypothetical protein
MMFEPVDGHDVVAGFDGRRDQFGYRSAAAWRDGQRLAAERFGACFGIGAIRTGSGIRLASRPGSVIRQWPAA